MEVDATPRSFASLILACGVLGLTELAGLAQVPQKSVLALYAGGRDAVFPMAMEPSFQRVIRKGLHGSLDYYAEFMDLARFPDPNHAEAVRAFLRSKYNERRFDLIVAAGDAELEFLSRYRDDLFPGVPILFNTAVPVDALPNSTGLVARLNLGQTLDMALRIQPDTQRVVVVAGRSAFDQYYELVARNQFEPFEGRLAFTYLTGLPIEDLLRQMEILPSRSVVLFLSLTEDGESQRFLPTEMLESVSAAANAPTFVWLDVGMTQGIVGGRMHSPEALATRMAELALRLLNGEQADAIPVTEVDWSVNAFDWRQLQRWNIGESRLPANSTILFKQPGTWQLYGSHILYGALIVLVQSALIVGLVVQRARRRRMELALRESEERFRLMANGVPVMVWTAAPDMKTDFYNNTVLEFTGLPIEQLLGDGWLEHLHPDDVEPSTRIYVPAFERRQPFQMEYRFRRADGTYRWVLDTGVPRYGPDGAFAGYIGSALDITERKDVEQSLLDNQTALRRSYDQNRDLAGRLIHAQEAERTRIARDLHDDVSQQLAGIGIMLSGLKRNLSQSGAHHQIDEVVAALQERIAAIAQSLRNLSHELHPGVLKHAGLVAALTQHCTEIERHHGITVTFTAWDEFETLDSDVALCLYRVTQEALTNVVRHAQASAVLVQLMRTETGVELRIADNGVGFVASERTGSGLGLRSIDERVRLTGGNVRVDSRPGLGTNLQVSIPLAVPVEFARLF